MINLNKQSLLLFVFIIFAFFANAQTIKPIPSLVKQSFENNASFHVCSPFTVETAEDQTAAKFVQNAQYLTLDTETVKSISENAPATISLVLPYNGNNIHIDLVRSQVATEDFTILSSNNERLDNTVGIGAHYRGIISGNYGSVASFSFFPDGEIMGIASDNNGNLVLGRLDIENNRTHYILYNDRNLESNNPAVCGTPDKEDLKIQSEQTGAEVTGCVRVYLECDYELYQNKMTVQATVNYMIGAMNQVATLYANDAINMKVSQLYIWVTADAFSTSSSLTVLDQFRALRTSFNGDVAHLTGIGGNNLGGIAYTDVLCFNGYNISYSDINTSFSTVPTYSWTVEVMAHEIGHNLGSNHTQWCGWTGGALDNCYAVEGTCTAGPAPVNGGTIMSYCHLSSVGINFANGFGAEPGKQLRARVSGSTCLAATCSTESPCVAPTDIAVTNISGSGATINWSLATGTVSNTLKYRAVGSAAWVTVSNATSPYTMIGLPSNDEIEVTISSNCGTASSESTHGVVFVTSASSAASICNNPTGLTATATSFSTANISWTAVSGATSYYVMYKVSSSATWGAPVLVSGTSLSVSGLSGGNTYNVQVQTVCGTQSSVFSTTTFVTPAEIVCGSATNLSGTISPTTANLTWTAASGATSYLVCYKTAASSTWSTPVTVTTTNYTLTGLTESTAYNAKVQAVCGSATNQNQIILNFTTSSSVTCGVPLSIGVANVTSSSANVTWGAATGAVSYYLSYKTSASTTWSNPVTVNNTYYTLSGLSAATTYNVRVQAICSAGVSSYINASLTTSAAATSCGTPTSLTISNVLKTSAIINWTAVAGAQSYTIQYKRTSSSFYTTISSISGNTRQLTNLTAGKTYMVKVRSNCANNISSSYSAVYYFTTPSNMEGGNEDGIALQLQEEGAAEDREEEEMAFVSDENMQVSPNPATDIVRVGLKFEEETTATVELINLMGRQVSAEKVTLTEGNVAFPLTDVPSGVYFIRLSAGENQTFTKKIIKQ